MPPVNGIPWALWRTTLAQWAQLSGLPVVWARQATNPPQMPKTYALLDVVSVEQIGLDEQQNILDTATGLIRENIVGVRQVVFNVQVFAPATGRWEESAWPWIDDLQASFGRTSVQVLLQNSGMSRINASTARDISNIEGAQFNSRVTLDITFLCAYYRPDLVGGPAIARVIGAGDIEDNVGNEVNFDVSDI